MTRKIFTVLILLSIVAFTSAQTKADLAGTWKTITQVSMGKQNPPPTYMALNADGTYLWGIDSTTGNPLKDVVKGTWDVTSDGDIKFMFTGSKDPARYYTKRGDMYEYDGYEENGKKKHEIVLEISSFIQKVEDTYQVK